MTHLKLSRWVKRGAFTLIACAALAMISAEQAQAQYYGGRGVSIGSFGRGGGLSISIGNSGFSRGYGGGFSRGYGGGYSNYGGGYRYAPQRSYYRGGGGYYGGGGYGRGGSYYGRRY